MHLHHGNNVATLQLKAPDFPLVHQDVVGGDEWSVLRIDQFWIEAGLHGVAHDARNRSHMIVNQQRAGHTERQRFGVVLDRGQQVRL